MDEVQQQQQDGIVHAASISSPSSVASSQRKRSLASSPNDTASTGFGSVENRRKAPKISRACDLCKVKKTKCTGTRPCENCTRKGVLCEYDAEYRRGRPPTPPLSVDLAQQAHQETENSARPLSRSSVADQRNQVERVSTMPAETNDPSRSSPDLEVAEIEGQYFDPTSGLTFLHRAWKRLSAQTGKEMPDAPNGAEKSQRMMTAGDRQFDLHNDNGPLLPDINASSELLELYFNVCVVTYHFLHRHTVVAWLRIIQNNSQTHMPLHNGLGHAKTAVVLTILGIAEFRQERIRCSLDDKAWSTTNSDQYFCTATSLTETETGLPRLESAQARLLQVLYLLQTTRMNQAWYVFGNAVQIISALGLHRKRKRNGSSSKNPSSDYVHSQCRKRTFWVAYTIDIYLCVVLGRPRHYHDDDIDQDFPDLVNDEDMTADGPSSTEPLQECHLQSLVFHAKLAQMIGATSRAVYSIKHISKRDRVAAAHRFGRELRDWRASLPPHLGTVKPAALLPTFRRQATALKLAYAHAVMHANRPFLLGGPGGSENAALDASTQDCLAAAKAALETVDGMAGEGMLFHALWWTHYVTFCALAVVYVWEIQQRAAGRGGDAPRSAANGAVERDRELTRLFDLAERCQKHLGQATAEDSPNRRYSVILEELRLEARCRSPRRGSTGVGELPAEQQQQRAAVMSVEDGASATSTGGMQQTHFNQAVDPVGLGEILGGQNDAAGPFGIHNPLSEWQTTDWLDLDSSAFVPFLDFDGSPEMWF